MPATARLCKAQMYRPRGACAYAHGVISSWNFGAYLVHKFILNVLQ